ETGPFPWSAGDTVRITSPDVGPNGFRYKNQFGDVVDEFEPGSHVNKIHTSYDKEDWFEHLEDLADEAKAGSKGLGAGEGGAAGAAARAGGVLGAFGKLAGPVGLGIAGAMSAAELGDSLGKAIRLVPGVKEIDAFLAGLFYGDPNDLLGPRG